MSQPGVEDENLVSATDGAHSKFMQSSAFQKAVLLL